MERRFKQHASGRGAKYFRLHRPSRLVYAESGHSRSTAGKRELEIKAMKHAEKLSLVSVADLMGENRELFGHPAQKTVF